MYRNMYSQDVHIRIVERNQVCKNGIYFSSFFLFFLSNIDRGYHNYCSTRYVIDFIRNVSRAAVATNT